MLASFKLQTKIPSRSGVYVQGEWQKDTPPTPLLSKEKRVKNIQYNMSIRNLIFCINSVTVSYLIRSDSLLKNATEVIKKCESYFITKCNRSLLVYTKCNLYYKMRRLYCKCDSYYKMKQIWTVKWKFKWNEWEKGGGDYDCGMEAFISILISTKNLRDSV